MPNELDGEEGMFVGYYSRLYPVTNRETELPYVDCYSEPKVDPKNVKKVIELYLDRIKKMKGIFNGIK